MRAVFYVLIGLYILTSLAEVVMDARRVFRK